MIGLSLISLLEYHTNLHHSQTINDTRQNALELEYHTNLHHSQTPRQRSRGQLELEYHTNLHHSQTVGGMNNGKRRLEYHTNLHHSQTYLPDEFREAGLSTILIYIILKPQTSNSRR